MEIPQEVFYGGMAGLSTAVIALFKQQTESRIKCENSNGKMFDKIETLVGRVGYLEGFIKGFAPLETVKTHDETSISTDTTTTSSLTIQTTHG
jgi:hypothetical protein